MKEECRICKKLAESSFLLVKDFEHSSLHLGDHSYFKGYCVLYLKKHFREMHELEETIQLEVFKELMISARAISVVFKPWKLNYSCYGNQVEHIHWHIFPRYEDDPNLRQHPWLNMANFSHFPRTSENSQDELKKLKKYFISFDQQNQIPS